MEEVRYRPYGAAGFQNLDLVNVRTLTENRTMYTGRSHWHPSWGPWPMKTSHQHIQLRIGGKKPKARSSSKGLKLWWNDPELKRRGRVARYKLYGAEGKVKSSLKKGFRWFKKKCLEIVRTI